MRPRLAPALGVSLLAHAGVVLVVIVLISTIAIPAHAPALRDPAKLVFIQQSGHAGGGGGSLRPAPPRPMEIPQHRPSQVIPVVMTSPLPEPPVPVLDAPVVTNAATVLTATGTTPFVLPGPGGGGTGDGLGPGKGPGIWPGDRGGLGGGPRGPGAGLVPPVPTYQARPQYTAGAMQAKITGVVLLEVEVLANGTVGSARVLRSLDRRYGLDEEAIRTAKLWRFKPATIAGKPVETIVQIALEFRIY